MKTQIEELELVINGTNTLAVRDEARAELVSILRPIAETIPQSTQYAADCTVATKEEADAAAKIRDQIVENSRIAEKALAEFDDKLIERLFRAHRAWTALRGLFTGPLDAAAKTIKGKIIRWQEDESEKARKEQARLQAEVDERARKERDRLLREAEKLKTPEKIEERQEAAAAVIAPIVTVTAPVAEWVKIQRRWTVVNVDRAEFLEAAAKDASLRGYVRIDESALARSKAANSELVIPGVTFEKRAI